VLDSSLEGAGLFNKVAVAAREPAQPENDWHRRATARAGVDDGKLHRAAEHRACVLVPARGRCTVRVSRGGVERCQVSALCLLWCCMSAPHCDRLLSAHSLVHAGAKRLLALLHSRHPVDPLQSHELGQWRKRGTVGHAHCACTQCYITLHHVALHHATSCRKARRQRYITLHHATSRSVTSRNHAERHAGTHKRVRPHADACAALFVGARCSIRWRTTSGAPLLALHLAPPTLNPEP
jgi:hypothetical protein